MKRTSPEPSREEAIFRQGRELCQANNHRIIPLDSLYVPLGLPLGLRPCYDIFF
jgi:hypothetical protein